MNLQTQIPMIETVSGVLRDMLGDDFDEATFLDTLDGETDAMDIIGRLIRDREEAKAHATASKELAAEYTTRAARLVDKQTAVNKALGAVLDAMDVQKVTHPLGTVSRTKARVGVVIDNEAEIPSQLCRTTVTPDRTAIKAQLAAGEAVPGAHLETGEPGLTVRVK